MLAGRNTPCDAEQMGSNYIFVVLPIPMFKDEITSMKAVWKNPVRMVNYFPVREEWPHALHVLGLHVDIGKLPSLYLQVAIRNIMIPCKPIHYARQFPRDIPLDQLYYLIYGFKTATLFCSTQHRLNQQLQCCMKVQV